MSKTKITEIIALPRINIKTDIIKENKINSFLLGFEDIFVKKAIEVPKSKKPNK